MKINVIILAIAMVSLILLGAAVFQNLSMQRQMVALVNQQKSPGLTANNNPSAQPLTSPVPIATVQLPSSPTEQVVGELAEIDSNWNQYTNHQLGFSVKVPKFTWDLNGDCEWNTKNGDHSYRVKNANVPVVIVTEPAGIYITPKYQAVLSGETKEQKGAGAVSYFSNCEKPDLTLANLSTARRTWHIIVKSANSQAELETAIKQQFGSGCKLGQLKPSQQTGIFDVQVVGDGQELDQTQCPLNYLYVLKYSPSQLKLFTWDLGQAVTFTNQKGSNFDQEMVTSFKVL